MPSIYHKPHSQSIVFDGIRLVVRHGAGGGACVQAQERYKALIEGKLNELVAIVEEHNLQKLKDAVKIQD